MEFSGFMTAKQETHYDKTVEYAFELICYKLLELFKALDILKVDNSKD